MASHGVFRLVAGAFFFLSILAQSQGARIVNGKRAAEGQFPFSVYLFSDALESSCGGTLIAPNYVLTAGHCVSGNVKPPGNDFTVLYNSTYNGEGSYSPPKYSVTRRSVRYTIHPSYNDAALRNDIAIIELAPFKTANAGPFARLATSGQRLDVPGITGYIAGWGDTKQAGENQDFTSTYLLFATVKLTQAAPCVSFWSDSESSIDFNKQVCTTVLPSDVCDGDSGGPLMALSNKVYYQIGLTSFGEKCASTTSGATSVFTRVRAYLPWICSVTKKLVASPNAALCK